MVKPAFVTFAGILMLLLSAGGASSTTPTSAAASLKGLPRFSEWIDARHGWTWYDPSSRVYTTGDGGRTWQAVFTGSNALFNPSLWTSRSAGLLSTGRQAGATFWTNDGGLRWYGTGIVPLGATVAGRGSLLFWHQRGETLYRVEGWPPRGDFQCTPPEDWPPGQPRGHRVCLGPPGDAGMRSVFAARLDRGFGGMRSVAGGIVAPFATPTAPTPPWAHQTWPSTARGRCRSHRWGSRGSQRARSSGVSSSRRLGRGSM